MSAELVGTGVDRQVALSRVGGDEELLREIAGLFLEDYPKALAELHEAAAKQDAKAVERTAHGLKGSVANFGAQAAVDAAFTIERMGRAEELDRLQEKLQTLEQALAALRPELESL